jgi:hypothetical protein
LDSLLDLVYERVKSLSEEVESRGFLKFDHYVFHDRLTLTIKEVFQRFLSSTSNLVLKVKPYLYGTRKDMHDPECEIIIKVDLSMTHSHWVDPVGAGPTVKQGYAGVDVKHRCSVDLLKKEIRDKKGNIQPVFNLDQVIEAIKMIVGEDI